MQEILNRYPPRGPHWMIPDCGLIAVRCRIHWQHDGIEWIDDALAKRWTGQHVWVEFPDFRLHGGGVWLKAKDVKRR